MWPIDQIPSNPNLETRKVYKKVVEARAALAELKGLVGSIPNQSILINTLGIKEAKDSSAIENIITTLDELFKSELDLQNLPSSEAKEVQHYISAMKRGFEIVRDRKILTTNGIIGIQQVLEANNAGLRRLPGTALRNARAGEVIYTPPQTYDEVSSLMGDLEKLINNPDFRDYDPLVKMAIIHFQFESIHPFYDGNGRTGRIINILYLILEDLLDYPVLYLSSYIIRNKSDYYQLLQAVREEEDWESWIIYMVQGVAVTARDTIDLIRNIQLQMKDMKFRLRSSYKFYSHDLLVNLFKYPYTKIDFVAKDLGVDRRTATKYLNRLANDGILIKNKIGRSIYYVNEDLYHLFLTR